MKACSRLVKPNQLPWLARAYSSSTPEVAAKQLQRLHVPELNRTLNRYLRSVRPFLTPEEFVRSEAIIKEFGAPGGEGECLQALLHEKASREENWLKDWWLNTAYLEFRYPVVVWSSPGEIFPKMKFSKEEDMLKCATNMISAALDFKRLVDNNEIAQEMMGKDPLDMSQYKMVFGTCRIPCEPRDRLVFHPKSDHVTVMYNNNVYKMIVAHGGIPFPKEKIHSQLGHIVKSSKVPAPPVGVLTTDNRDNWAQAYSELSKDEVNKKSLKEIEESLFVVCLDSVSPTECVNDMTTSAVQMIHGGGPANNSGNRWFDKTIQFVVGKEGHVGLTYEHSPAEGQPIAVLTDHIVKHISDDVPDAKDSDIIKPIQLVFNISDKVQQMITTAQCNLENLVNDLEVYSFSFGGFGKNAIKEQKLSPDSFIQMAIQYAFYRMHGVPAAQYESASLRKFVGGRTETIRSCSEESVRFAQAMQNTKISDQSKANALRVAVNSHKDYTIAALNGQGVDRHLLGLKLLAKENNMGIPKLYSDVAFTRSSTMRMSTSQVASQCDAFMNYGPLVNDGYGCCYNPRKSNINFGTSSFVSCSETSAAKLHNALEASLCEMIDVLRNSPQSKL